MTQEQQTLAQRYAQALFDHAVESQQLETVGQQLQHVVQLLSTYSEFHRVVTSPIFPAEQRKSIVRMVADKSGYHAVVVNFLLLLLDQQRGDLLQAIQEGFQHLQDKHQNRVHAEVTTTRPASAEYLKQLEQQLKQATHKEIVLHVSTDNTLMGGVSLKMGDRMLDGSIRTQLRQMKEQLLRQL